MPPGPSLGSSTCTAPFDNQPSENLTREQMAPFALGVEAFSKALARPDRR